MSKERLSKLQKWILIQAYKNAKTFSFDGSISYSIQKKDIYEGFFGIKCEDRVYSRVIFIDPPPKSKVVILSRSIRLLCERDYLESDGIRSARSHNLSAKGVSKAKELLKVNCAPGTAVSTNDKELLKVNQPSGRLA